MVGDREFILFMSNGHRVCINFEREKAPTTHPRKPLYTVGHKQDILLDNPTFQRSASGRAQEQFGIFVQPRRFAVFAQHWPSMMLSGLAMILASSGLELSGRSISISRM